MDILSIIIGIIIGGIIAYIIFLLFNKTQTVSKQEYQHVSSQLSTALTELHLVQDRIKNMDSTYDLLSQKLASKEKEVVFFQTRTASLETQVLYDANKISELLEKLGIEEGTNKIQQNEINIHKQHIAELTANNNAALENFKKQSEVNDRQIKQIDHLNAKNNELTAELGRLEITNMSLLEKLSTQRVEVEELQKTAHLQFEKIANKLFEEKSSKFTATNKTNLETLLNPLKEDIHKFKTRVEETYDKESKERFSLEQKVKDLIEQTNKVSEEANNLATALKGKPQKRGNWGEMILERILESSGLTKGREYVIQQSIKDENGIIHRPDVRVNLPDDRAVIIDSKVSLIGYDKFVSTDNIEEQKIYLGEHLRSTYEHIDQLSSKNYDNLESSLDFTMMFVPIEPAYLIAIQTDSDLWSYAYAKRILLVSPTNLIACLKLISDLWKREWQSKNAMEIVKRGEALYDKFVGFTKTFEEIGYSIKSSQEKYDKALGQLKEGRGNLINHAIQLKNLGLKSSKAIPSGLMPLHIEDESESDNRINQEILPE